MPPLKHTDASMPTPAPPASPEPEQSPTTAPATKPTVALTAALIVLAVATVAASALIGGKSYVVASALLIAYFIVPFLVRFEHRRPQAREIAMLAMMCALAVASRAAFAWLPGFKPIAGVVMLSGIAFGPSFGFLTGAMSMLASNFMFGQGPWTPWQMLAFGLCGLTFGALGKAGIIPRARLSRKALLATSIAGAAFMVVVAGPVLDTCSVLMMLSSITPTSALAVYAAGLPANCMQAAATFATLLLLANPLLNGLARLRKKYGA